MKLPFKMITVGKVFMAGSPMRVQESVGIMLEDVVLSCVVLGEGFNMLYECYVVSRISRRQEIAGRRGN